MTGGYVNLLQGIELLVLLVPDPEDLPVLTPAQFLKDLVVPQAAVLAHMTLHFILFITYQHTNLPPLDSIIPYDHPSFAHFDNLIY